MSEEQHPQPLDYRDAEADAEAGADTSIFALKTFVGFVLSAVLVLASVLAAVLTQRSAGPGRLALLVILAYALAVAPLAVAAVLLRRKRRLRGWSAGIWLGIGFATLLEGICFLR